MADDKVSLTGSVRSIKSVKSRSGSMKGMRSTRSSVRSVHSVKERPSILEESIFKTRDVEVDKVGNVDNVDNVDKGSVGSRTGSVRSVKSNRSSVRSVQSVKERPTILQDSVFKKEEEEEVEDDNISVKTLTEEEENKEEDSYSYKAREDTESIMGDDDKDPEVFYKENGYDNKGDGDNVSIISYDVNSDYIPSLHQRVGSVRKAAQKAEAEVSPAIEDSKVETAQTTPEPVQAAKR